MSDEKYLKLTMKEVNTFNGDDAESSIDGVEIEILDKNQPLNSEDVCVPLKNFKKIFVGYDHYKHELRVSLEKK